MSIITAGNTRRGLFTLALCCAALVALPAQAPAAGGLTVGRGQIVDPTPPDGDFYSFSFLARGKQGVSADGFFSLSNPSRGFSLTGAVDCLRVTGDDAVLSGRISSQKGVGPGAGGVGDTFLAFVTDASGPQTFFSPFTIQGSLPGLCAEASGSGGYALERGGIVVKE